MIPQVFEEKNPPHETWWHDLEENNPLSSSNQTVLTFALRGPAASSPGTMHANYQPAIMIRPCRRRRRRRRAWREEEERKMEVCSSVTRVVGFEKKGEGRKS